MRMSDDRQQNILTASGRRIDRALTRLLARGLQHEGAGATDCAEDLLPSASELLEHQVRLRTEELERSQREAIRTLVRVAAHRDDDSGAHPERIGLYASQLAHHMGMDTEYCTRIALASRLHDIGKIGVPDLILKKRGALNASEWRVMRTHCAIGAGMLAQNSSSYLRMAADIARSHHERWDGSGYPDRLSGEAIPRAARILRLCDCYDALRSHLPYKRAVDHDAAVRAILGGDPKSRPRYFDPAVLAAFESGHAAFREIHETVREAESDRISAAAQAATADD